MATLRVITILFWLAVYNCTTSIDSFSVTTATLQH